MYDKLNSILDKYDIVFHDITCRQDAIDFYDVFQELYSIDDSISDEDFDIVYSLVK